MNKTQKLTISFAAAFLLFLILYLVIINPFAQTDDYSPSVDYDPSVGEGVYLNTPTMYDQYLQEHFNIITVKNEKGVYRLCQPAKNTWLLYTYNNKTDYDTYLEGYNAANADKDSETRRFGWRTDTENWTPVTLSELYGEHLAELRVAVGVAYYQSKASYGAEGDAEKYGIDGKTFYEFDATKDGVDVSRRVYVGNISQTLNNYYLQIEGTDRVYVAHGDRSCLEKGAEYLVSPQIVKPANLQSHYYLKDFSIYSGTTLLNESTMNKTDADGNKIYSASDLTVKKGDIVEVAYYIPGKIGEGENERELGDGDRIYAVYDTSDESLPESLINGLLGMEISTSESKKEKEILVHYAPDYSEKLFITGNFEWVKLIWFNATQSYKHYDGDTYKDDLSETGRTTKYNFIVTGIIRSDEEFIKLGWLNQSEREPFYQHTTYKTSGAAADYTVNTDTFFEIVDLFENMEGSEVVSLTLDANTIEKYGLDAHTVYYKLPLGIENENDEDDDINILVYKYDENVLFISEKDEDGYRYVGSWYYGTVVKVLDSESFKFLDWDFYEYVEETMFATEIKYMETIKFEFNYADRGAETFTVSLDHTFTDPENPDVYSSTVKINGQTVNTSDHASLYTFLASIRYTGPCDLSKEDADALYADDGKCVLKLTFTLNGNAGAENAGRQFVYRFYPYSSDAHPARQVMASTDGKIYFSVNTTDIQKLYYDIDRLLKGESVDYNDKY